MIQRNNNADIPDWKCERYLLNELDDAEMERIRRAAESDESLRQRLDALEKSNHEIHQSYPPGWMSRRIQEKLEGTTASTSGAGRAWRLRIPRMVLVPVAIVALFGFSLFVLPNLLTTRELISPEITRIKGPESQLRLYRKTSDGSQRLQDGDSAAEHDLVLLQYRVDDEAYGAIFSVDGRGTVTRHLPVEGNEAVQILPQQPHFLDYAYELDDAPRWEIFMLLTSASPFEVEPLIQHVETSTMIVQPPDAADDALDVLTNLGFPDGFSIASFTLVKDTDHED